jgi:hypothetical protein
MHLQDATAISAMIAAPASEESRPIAKSRPAPISVNAARRAWSQPGRMPMLSNHCAVPVKRPPRKI